MAIGADRARVSTVENRECQWVVERAKKVSKHGWREAGATHAQQERMGIAVAVYVVGKLAEISQFASHAVDTLQPSQAVVDLGGFRFPDGVIPIPETG